MIRSIVLSLMLMLAGACAQLPKAELQGYTAAFEATRRAAEPLMADTAIAERSERLLDMQTDTERGFNDFFPAFRVTDTAALSTASLPPGAAAVDRTFRAISHYNETLVALAENRNIEEAQAQLNQVLDDLGAIAPPLADSKMPLIKPVANLLVNVLRPAIVADNRERFKEIVLDGQPLVKQMIGLLRGYTPTQYDFTTSALQAQLVADPAPAPADRKEIVDKINGWHRAFADYVALLNSMEQRLDDLANAVRFPKSVPFLQRAATGSAELREYADALRLSLARLRTNP